MRVCKHDGLPVHLGPGGHFFHDNPVPLLRTIARDTEEERARNHRLRDEAGNTPYVVKDIDYSWRVSRRPQLRPKISYIGEKLA